MDGFQMRKEKKKKSILQAAQELFSSQGVKNTTVAEIAAKARVSQVTLYNYFGSKNNLVKEVIGTFMEEKWTDSEKIIESALSFPQKIEKIILEKAQVEHQSPWFVHAIALADSEIQDLLESYYQKRSIPLLIKLIEQGKKEGFVDLGLSNEAVLFYLNIFKEAMNQPEFLWDKNKGLRLDLTRLFFYGLMGKPLQQ